MQTSPMCSEPNLGHAHKMCGRTECQRFGHREVRGIWVERQNGRHGSVDHFEIQQRETKRSWQLVITVRAREARVK